MTFREAAAVGVVAVAGRVGAQEAAGSYSSVALKTYAAAQVRSACGLYESLGGSCEGMGAGESVADAPLRDVGNTVMDDGNVDGTGQFIPAAMREFRDTGDVALLRGALDRYIAWEGSKWGLSIRQFRLSSDIACEYEGEETRIKCTWTIVDEE